MDCDDTSFHSFLSSAISSKSLYFRVVLAHGLVHTPDLLSSLQDLWTPVCDNYKPFSPSRLFSNHFHFAISSDSHNLPQDLASCLPPHPYHHLHFTPNAALITSDTNLTAHSEHCFLALPPNSKPDLVTSLKGHSLSPHSCPLAQLSTDVVSALRKVWVLIRPWKQPNTKVRT